MDTWGQSSTSQNFKVKSSELSSYHYTLTSAEIMEQISLHASLLHIASNIWKHGYKDEQIVLSALQNLKVCAEIRLRFHTVGTNLIDGPTGHQCARLGKFIRFAFDPLLESRYIPLRQLDAHALIVCALSYPLFEIQKLSTSGLKLLLEGLPPFLQQQTVPRYFYKAQIRKYIFPEEYLATGKDFYPEDGHFSSLHQKLRQCMLAN